MKTEKKKTLRGSALFTVVAVMAILILFLTGTLALASASNSRAHKSYSVSQASYTARSAIRSFKAAMEDETDGAGIVAAVHNLGTGEHTGTLHPIINMGDNTMGNIGYWNEDGIWERDRLTLEPVTDRVDWVYEGDKWVPYNVVRLTATCRLGREEETVMAYISKHSETVDGESPVSDSEVKGLQEAGGNTFMNGGDIYGGLGVALADDPSDGLGEYELNNEFKTHTTLNFINASVYNLTSTFEILVEKSNANPVSATVIMGNLSIKNNSFIVLKDSYEMNKNFRQKDIPYLYVDKLIYERQGTSAPYVKPEGGMDSTKFQPFNVYAGTMYYPTQFQARADLYLMDEPTQLADGSYEEYDATKAADPNPGNWEGVDQKIKKGENYFGCFKDGSITTTDKGSKQLFKWANSTFTRKDDYDSYGGNIYCNGNFHMGAAIINGNLRVKGDFYLEKAVNGYQPEIRGDLVVEGDIIDNCDAFDPDDIVTGLIYNDGLANGTGEVTVTIKDGYAYEEDKLYPGYTEMETAVLENRQLSEEGNEVILQSDGKYLVTIVDLGDKTFGTIPYIERVPLSENTFGDSDPYVITEKETSRYEVDKDGNFVFDEVDGKQVPRKTNEEYVYFDDEGNGPISESDAKGNYYRTTTEPYRRVDPSEACNFSAGSSKAVPNNQYYYGAAYPENMTREKIYGEYKDGKFVTNPDTKLVTTLDETRKALSWNTTDGEFDKTVYPYSEPESVPADHVLSGTLSADKVITRPESGFEWYILDNLEIQGGKNIYIKDAPDTVPTGNKQYGGGTIRFFIKGILKMNGNSRICLQNMPSTISYLDDFGIEYYGYAVEDESGSVIGKSRIKNENGNLIVGSIKAPYMELDSRKGDGPDSFKYIPESGEAVNNYTPIIIGNALIHKIQHYDWTGENIDPNGNMNNFKLAYTKSGTGSSSSSDSGEGTAHTVDGNYYFTYVVG